MVRTFHVQRKSHPAAVAGGSNCFYRMDLSKVRKVNGPNPNMDRVRTAGRGTAFRLHRNDSVAAGAVH